MAASVQFYRSVDGLPLCEHCAQAFVPWRRTFDDVLDGDRCGLGYLTAGVTQRQCFAYEGERAELVTINLSAPADDETSWQERADGTRFGRTK